MSDDKRKSKIGKVWASIRGKDKDKEPAPEGRRLNTREIDLVRGDSLRVVLTRVSRKLRLHGKMSGKIGMITGPATIWAEPAANLYSDGITQESPRRNRGTHWPDSSDDDTETFESQAPRGRRPERVNSMDHMRDYESLSSSPETREPVRSSTDPVSPTRRGHAQRVQRRTSSESDNADRINHNVPGRENSPSPSDESDEELRLAIEMSIQEAPPVTGRNDAAQEDPDADLRRAIEVSAREAQRDNDLNATEEAWVAEAIKESLRLAVPRPRPLEKTVRPAQRSSPTPQSSAENPHSVITKRSTPNVGPPVGRPPPSTQRSTPNVHPPVDKPRLGVTTQRITANTRPLVDSPFPVTPTKPSSADSSEPIDFETRVALKESLRTATP